MWKFWEVCFKINWYYLTSLSWTLEKPHNKILGFNVSSCIKMGWTLHQPGAMVGILRPCHHLRPLTWNSSWRKGTARKITDWKFYWCGLTSIYKYVAWNLLKAWSCALTGWYLGSPLMFGRGWTITQLSGWTKSTMDSLLLRRLYSESGTIT